MVDGSVTVITLQVVYTIARAHCTKHSIANGTEVRQGDVVGVLLSSGDPIPLIGARSNHTLRRFSGEKRVQRARLSSVSLALHLYADIIEGEENFADDN